MRLLYIGDIMAAPGITVVQHILPELQRELQIDTVIAQAENVSAGKSMKLADMRTLQDVGVDFFTGGNHTFKREELHPLLMDAGQPVIGPANMTGMPGPGWKYLNTPTGKVLVISLLGQIVGNTKPVMENPLKTIDGILRQNEGRQRIATIVNFHGDFSSEKIVIGYYLDGKVSAVIGDHWHVPTADAMVFPKGTAHITDVGMCGVLHSSLGVKTESIIPRWHDDVINVNVLETNGPLQFNAVLIDIDIKTGLARSIEQIQHIIER